MKNRKHSERKQTLWNTFKIPLLHSMTLAYLMAFNSVASIIFTKGNIILKRQLDGLYILMVLNVSSSNSVLYPEMEFVIWWHKTLPAGYYFFCLCVFIKWPSSVCWSSKSITPISSPSDYLHFSQLLLIEWLCFNPEKGTIPTAKASIIMAITSPDII